MVSGVIREGRRPGGIARRVSDCIVNVIAKPTVGQLLGIAAHDESQPQTDDAGYYQIPHVQQVYHFLIMEAYNPGVPGLDLPPVRPDHGHGEDDEGEARQEGYLAAFLALQHHEHSVNRFDISGVSSS